jgi:PAS domain S-box-containing protein
VQGLRPAGPSIQELLRLFNEQAQDLAVLLLRPDGVILDWLAGATRIFGFTAEEMVGQHFRRIFTPEDLARGAHVQELDIAASVGHAEDDRWQLRKDGTAFWASGVVFALRDAAGNVVGFVKLLRNRTDVKTQTEALENRIKALLEAEDQRKAFFGVVAHELRNPLAPLSSAVEIIRRSGALQPPVEAALQIIDRQLAAIRRLVDDMMDTVRVGQGKVDLERKVIDLRDVMNSAAASARPLAEARRQHFQMILIDAPVNVNGDAVRLEQVFVNLLTNAVKYTPAEGRIWFKVTIEGGDAVVRVEDSGVGIGPEMLPTIFELFTQEAASRRMSSGGLGLGLALVRELVKLHDGTVQARSDGRGKGSVFTVRLPLHGASQA